MLTELCLLLNSRQSKHQTIASNFALLHACSIKCPPIISRGWLLLEQIYYFRFIFFMFKMLHHIFTLIYLPIFPGIFLFTLFSCSNVNFALIYFQGSYIITVFNSMGTIKNALLTSRTCFRQLQPYSTCLHF